MNDPRMLATAPDAGAPPTLRPVAAHERIAALDVVRGFALAGILVVNMQAFAMPFMTIWDDDSLATAPWPDRLAWAFLKVACEFKFYSIFSLLFGAGLAMQMTRAHAAGRSVARVCMRRLAVLSGIGLVHGLGLWYGDILLIYSLVGAVAALVSSVTRRRTPWLLAGLAAVALCISGLASLGIAALELLPESEPTDGGSTTEAQVESADPARGWAAMTEAGFDPAHPAWLYGETQAYKNGPFLDALLFRAISFGYSLAAAAFGYGWHALAMFLLGAAFMRWNLFAPEHLLWQRNLAIFGIGIGLPLELLGARLDAPWVESPPHTALISMPLHDVASAVLCLGYVGLVCAIVSSGGLGAITRALACTGRLALTNYLLQTLISTFLMYWWGLAWFGDVDRPRQIGLALGIYLAQVLLSVAYSKRLDVGPGEWLWRAITYRNLRH